jgi:hypothetical protein
MSEPADDVVAASLRLLETTRLAGFPVHPMDMTLVGTLPLHPVGQPGRITPG